jgi:hypothetical protein
MKFPYQPNPMTTVDPADGLLLKRHQAYVEVVSRLREAVERCVPAGEIVLVVSKGDAALVGFDRQVGWHFPQDEFGRYAGHHPADSYDAIERLERLLKRGANFLAIPSTGRWWLDYYPAFSEHLRHSGEVVFDDPTTGIIFRLTPPADPLSTPTDVAVESSDPSIAQLRDLVESVLPEGCKFAVASQGNDDLLVYNTMDALHFPSDEAGNYAGDSLPAIANLRALAAGRADFLVVPAGSFAWLDDRQALKRHVVATYPLITRQNSVCAIYDLRQQKRTVPK